MTAMPAARLARPSLTTNPSELVFPFLAPSIQCARNAPYTLVARFSTSPALWKRDNNKNRGVSVLRHTGNRKRQTLSVNKYLDELPKPVKPSEPVKGDDDHGLWGFFRDKKLLRTPLEESRHGRAWTVAELRKRNWDDLHSLWWVCIKERNRLATEKIERQRQKAGYGDEENKGRDETVQETMKAILDTLAERHDAWEGAYQLAAQDPLIDLNKTKGPQLLVEAYDTEELDDVAPSGAKQEGKELPESRFFSSQENKPTLKEKVQEKTKKILWNK